MRTSRLQRLEFPNEACAGAHGARTLSLMGGATALHPALRTLDDFGVAYLMIARGDGAVRLSGAAKTLLAGAAGERVLAQAERLARARLEGRNDSGASPGTLVAVPSCDGSLCLTARELASARHPVAVVVTLQPTASATAEAPVPGLTAREAQVARLIGEGHGTKQIAHVLGISPHTARHHTERVFVKLGVRSRVAVALLLRGRMGASSHGAREEGRPA